MAKTKAQMKQEQMIREIIVEDRITFIMKTFMISAIILVGACAAIFIINNAPVSGEVVSFGEFLGFFVCFLGTALGTGSAISYVIRMEIDD